MCDIVRLLQRAEEGCEGLKHGYYNLPCIHFLIFLCHDIKNKIDRLVFYKEQNFSRLNKIFLERPQGYWNGRRLLERALAHLERPLANGTPARLSCGPCIVCWQEILSPSYYPLERPKGYWNARSATGTEPLALPGTREALLEPPYRATAPGAASPYIGSQYL